MDITCTFLLFSNRFYSDISYIIPPSLISHPKFSRSQGSKRLLSSNIFFCYQFLTYSVLCVYEEKQTEHSRAFNAVVRRCRAEVKSAGSRRYRKIPVISHGGLYPRGLITGCIFLFPVRCAYNRGGGAYNRNFTVWTEIVWEQWYFRGNFLKIFADQSSKG